MEELKQDAESGDEAGQQAVSPSTSPIGRKKSILIAVIAGSVVIGGLIGAMALGPMLSKDGTDARSLQKTPEPSGGVDPSPGSGAILELDNLILNPAGSMGRRLLMASVALEVPNIEIVKKLRERQVPLRDHVVSILERRTVESLGHPGARDSLKKELAVEIGKLIPEAGWVRVYLPQFVIQ